MVTAELAVGTVAVVILMVLLGGGLGLVGVRLQNLAVASELAEQVARGDERTAERTRRDLPDDLAVAVERSPNGVLVRVSRTVDPVGRLGPDVTITATARAVWQPGES